MKKRWLSLVFALVLMLSSVSALAQTEPTPSNGEPVQTVPATSSEPTVAPDAVEPDHCTLAGCPTITTNGSSTQATGAWGCRTTNQKMWWYGSYNYGSIQFGFCTSKVQIVWFQICLVSNTWRCGYGPNVQLPAGNYIAGAQASCLRSTSSTLVATKIRVTVDYYNPNRGTAISRIQTWYGPVYFRRCQ